MTGLLIFLIFDCSFLEGCCVVLDAQAQGCGSEVRGAAACNPCGRTR